MLKSAVMQRKQEVVYVSDNWVVQNLENALNTWNEKLPRYGSSLPSHRSSSKAVRYGLLS